MNREALSAAKPNWLELEHRPSAEKLAQCVRYVESIMVAIVSDARQPDDWEAKHLVYAIHAIVEERFYAAITFAEMAVIEPEAHRPSRVHADGLPPVEIAMLHKALQLLKAKRMPSI